MDFSVNATHSPNSVFQKTTGMQNTGSLRDSMSPDSIHMNIVHHYLNTLHQNLDFQMVPSSPSPRGATLTNLDNR